MSLTSWIQRRFSSHGFLRDLRRSHIALRRRGSTIGHRYRWLERLESRVLLTSDFGDAPSPYPTTLAEHGAMHTAIGPMLGANRDGEPDGTHSATANSDDITGTPNDEDGVTFQTIRAGELGAKVTVVVSNAPNGAKLDAWIDFNGDGNWGGASEHIAGSVAVVNGINSISFDVPTDACDGQSFARFRVSTTGNLGPIGAAIDGEVEDCMISIRPPIESSGKFGLSNPIAETGVIHALTDLDRDGDLDIVEREEDGLYWLENDGNTQFSRHFLISIDSSAYLPKIRVADLDGDGDVDVIVATNQPTLVQWYENDGRQNFSAHTITTNTNYIQDIDVADVDSDGDLDVLTASLLDDKIAWFENDGHQSFLERVITTQATRAWSVTACDLDRDGDLDVVWQSQYGALSWSENDGKQTFTQRTISTSSFYTYAGQVAPVDLDHDGDLDVLATATDYYNLIWYENDGQQHFTARPSLTSGAEEFSVADADGDGDFDVVCASHSGSYVRWLINDGGSHFSDSNFLALRAHTGAVLPGDLNHDGRLDLVIGTGSEGDFTIAWYVNRFDILPPSLKNSPLAPVDPSQDLSMTVGAVPVVRMRIKNPTDEPATLFGWIDSNRDGVFDDATERTSIVIPADTGNGLFRLTFPRIPLGTAPGPANVRFVLMSDGSANEGTEVIVSATITQRTLLTADRTKSVKLASGLGLLDYGTFGASVTALGDLDGNGVTDVAVGGAGNEDGYGNVQIVFLNQDGTAKESHSIGSVDGWRESFFGASMASIGDINGDGIPDLAVGANGYDSNSGAVYVVTLRSDGYVSKSVKIAAYINGAPMLAAGDSFGVSVAALGDLDGDGVADLAVGAEGDGTGGAVYILFLNSDGTVKSRTKIASFLNGGPIMAHADHFGVSMASLGDLDGDGVTDLAVGAYQDQTGGKDRGAAYVLFLNSNGTVKRSVKLASGMNGTPALANGDQFGGSMASLGDLDGNGVNDLAVGTMKVNSSGLGSGAVNLLLLNSDGTVKSSSRLASNTNGVPALPGRDFFAGSIASLGDVDGDGAIDLAVGAFTDSTDGLFHGAVHLLFLKPVTNKAPVFTKGPNQTVLEDAAAQSMNWATAISAGVGDVGQQVHFEIKNNSNTSLFSVLPTISTTGVLTYTPAPNANGIATVSVVLKDDGGSSGGGQDTSAVTTFTITVSPVNDAPLRVAGMLPTINIDEDSANTTAVALGLSGLTYVPGPAGATDEGAQTLIFKITSIPKFMTLFKADGTTALKVNSSVTAAELQGLKFKTVANLFGTGDLNFTVSDSGKAPSAFTETVKVTVNPINDAPSISHIADQTIAEDSSSAAIKFTVDDIEDKPVNLNAVTVTATSSNANLVPNLPANIVLGGSAGSRTIQLKPAADQFGTTTITVTATDSSGATMSGTFALTVTAINDAPRVTIATLSVSEFTTNDSVIGTVAAVDPEGDAVTSFAITGGDTGNAFKIDNAGVIRVNDATKIDFESIPKYTLTIKATDALGVAGMKANETGPITINVENQSISLAVAAIDTDNTVTVSKAGNNLVARRGLVDVITPTSLEDVSSLTIIGGTAKDTVILDASLNSAGKPASHKFTGQIVVNGNNGDDKLDASKVNVATFGIVFNGGNGNDTAIGGAGHDTLVGNDGNDSLSGGAGDDLLSGGRGDDQLVGGAGNDTYLFGDTDQIETDTLTEVSKGGTDLLDFGGVTANVTAKLTSDTVLAIHTNRTIKTSATGTTTFASNFENVIGGSGDDAILGNTANNSLVGGAGSDTIIGAAGNDTLRGGDHNDTLIGGLGGDFVFGDSGSDLGLVGRGGVARGGTGIKETGDFLDESSIEFINEAFATVFTFE